MIIKLLLLAIYGILQLYFGVIIISFILSWIPGSHNWKIGRMIFNASNWYMESFRGKLIIGIFDMGSLVGYVVYEFLMNLLWQCISIL